jgi:hypothetical protein
MSDHLRDPPRIDDVIWVVRRHLRGAGLVGKQSLGTKRLQRVSAIDERGRPSRMPDTLAKARQWQLLR